VLDPQTLAHRSYRRHGEEQAERAFGERRIESEVVHGYSVLRSRLNREAPPKLYTALAARCTCE